MTLYSGSLLSVQAMKRRFSIKYSLIVFVLLGALTCSLVLLLASKPEFHVSGHPMPIKLVGVQMDGAEVMFGPEGRQLPKPLALATTRLAWDSDDMQRDFVFEMPEVSEPVLFDPFVQIRVSRTERMLGSSQYSTLDAESRLFVKSMTFDFEYRERLISHLPSSRIRQMFGFIPWTRMNEVEYVDLIVKFYSGPRQPADYEFAGPFEVGVPVTSVAAAGTVTFNAPRSEMVRGSFIFRPLITSG